MSQRAKILFTSYIVISLLIICLLTVTTVYYATFNPNKQIPLLPEDIPFSEFIIGRWKSISVVDGDVPREGDLWFELEIMDDGTLHRTYHRLSLDGEDSDVLLGRYKFIKLDTILVTENHRYADEWVLERDGQDLVVVIDPNNINLKIVFTRIGSG